MKILQDLRAQDDDSGWNMLILRTSYASLENEGRRMKRSGGYRD